MEELYFNFSIFFNTKCYKLLRFTQSFFFYQDEMFIFMEYCADGTISDVAKLGLPETMIRVYTYQILVAVNVLHEKGIVHRDVKGKF